MAVPHPKLSVDTVCSLLESEYRRRILRCLDGAGELTLSGLARELCEKSENQEQTGAMEIRLHHAHLPKLAENRAIRYDAKRRVVSITEGGQQLLAYLDELET